MQECGAYTTPGRFTFSSDKPAAPRDWPGGFSKRLLEGYALLFEQPSSYGRMTDHTAESMVRVALVLIKCPAS